MNFSFVLEWYFVAAYCGLILIFFFWCAYSLSSKASHLNSALADSTRRIKGKSEQDFKEVFGEYDSRMEQSFGTPWKEFVETLDIRDDDPAAPIRNTQPVSRYLNYTSVIFPKISFDFYRSVPNLLTGSGILGTFIGLAVGVGAASEGLASGVSQQLNDSLQQLLHGAYLAFLTSIAGISSSMAFVWVERRASGTLRRALDEWVLGIESCVRRVTSEGVALRQLEQARRATQQLERFNTDLVFSIEKALDENIAGRLSPQLDRLVEAVKELGTDRSTDAATMIAEVADKFAQTLKNRTGTEFDEMATTISGLSRSLQGVADGMEATQRATREALADIVASVRTSMGNSTGAMTDALQRALGRLTQDLEERTGAKFDEMATTIAGLNRAIQGSTDAMEQSQRDIRRTLEQVVSAVQGSMGESANDIAEAWRLALDQFTNAMKERTGGEFDQMAETIRALNRALTDATGDMAKSQQELRTALDRIVASVNTSMTDGAGAVTATLRELLGQLTEVMESVSGKFTTQLASASTDAASALRAAADSLSRAAADAALQITGSLGGVEAAAKSLDGSTRQSKRILDRMTTFAAQIDSLASVIELAHRRVSEVAAPIALAANAMKEASGTTAAALEDTRTVAGGIGEAVATLGHHEERIATAWGTYESRFADIDESLVALFGELDKGLARYCEQVRVFGNELDNKTASVMRVLAGAIHEFHEAVEAEYEGRRRR